MALFIDGRINGLEDLAQRESGLLNVCSVEQIDVTAKMALAQDLIAEDLLSYLLRQSARAYVNQVFWCDGRKMRRAKGITDVVVTEPLKRWHALKTIALTYDDAYGNQLNDRYQRKAQQFEQLAKRAAGQLEELGVGIVEQPIVRAAAPLLFSVAGSLTAATYYVRTSWLNQAGQEGEASDAVALTTVDESQLVVSTGPAPAGVTAWNVYAGVAPDAVTLQNARPVLAGSDWTMPIPGLTLGRNPGTGQAPDRFIVDDRMVQRG